MTGPDPVPVLITILALTFLATKHGLGCLIRFLDRHCKG